VELPVGPPLQVSKLVVRDIGRDTKDSNTMGKVIRDNGAEAKMPHRKETKDSIPKRAEKI